MVINMSLICVKMLCGEPTSVGGVVQGVQPLPQNFWFGENPGKICGNLGKICENVRKIAVCALNSQKWYPKPKCRLFLEVLCVFSSFRAS